MRLLFGLLQEIRKTGLTLLIIEQNVQQTLEMADRAYVMENGQIVLEGTGKELLEHEHLRTHYLGVRAPRRVRSRPASVRETKPRLTAAGQVMRRG